MLIYKNGDILKSNKNLICHQVNANGVMGGGLALQIANKYPNVEKTYRKYCDYYNHKYEILRNNCLPIPINQKQTILNCFTQEPNFDTNYEDLEICFDRILKFCKKYKKSVCLPYKYGCGIANGNWEKIENILNNLSEKYKVDITIYKYKGEIK